MNEFVTGVLGRAGLTAVDVGARGDIPAHWLPLDGTARIVGFEPDPEACAALRERYASRGHGELYVNLPIALSRSGGPRTLYVTHVPGGSSLLPPDTAFLEAYSGHAYVHPVRERVIETRTLSDILDELGIADVALIKADVQGGEMEVIEGLGEARLEKVLALELEAPIEPQYSGSGTLFSLHAHLTARGFKLLDAHPWRGHRIGADGRSLARDIFRVHDDSPTMERRLLYVDAIFVRDPSFVIAERKATSVRRLATILCTYRYFTEAWNLVEEAASERILTTAERDEMLAGIRQWHDSSQFSRLFHSESPIWSVLRLAARAVGMVDRIGDEVAKGHARELMTRVVQRLRQVS